MKKRILFFALLLVTAFGYAQKEENVEFVPDRPGYTWGADVLAFQKISWENGFSHEYDNGTRTSSLSTIVRYGIFNNVELRVGTDFQLLEEPPYETKQFGVAPLTIGTKIKCFEGERFIPSVGVLAEIQSSRVGSANLLPSNIAPHLYLLLEQTPLESLSLCYNAGLEWDGESATPTTFLALGIWISITDDFAGFVETNNYLHPDGNQYLTSLGFTFSPTSRLQLDIQADFNIKNWSNYYCLGCGIAWMIN